MLLMLLQEGGQYHCHPRNPSQHMETALGLEVVIPTIGRNHHHKHFEPSHLHLVGGKFLPTYSI